MRGHPRRLGPGLTADDRARSQTAGGAKFLSSHLSLSRTGLLFITGRQVDAEKIYRLGAVYELITAGELLPTAVALGRDIAAKEPTREGQGPCNAVEELQLRDGYVYE